MPTVHQASWGLLRALGVRKVFGNPGSTEMPFLADFPDEVDYVLGLHEGAVVGMADGYAQLTGEPLTTSGVPGLDLDYLGYQALAEGYGIPAMRTGRPDELAVALKQAFAAAKGPHMIIVDVAPGVALGG